LFSPICFSNTLFENCNPYLPTKPDGRLACRKPLPPFPYPLHPIPPPSPSFLSSLCFYSYYYVQANLRTCLVLPSLSYPPLNTPPHPASSYPTSTPSHPLPPCFSSIPPPRSIWSICYSSLNPSFTSPSSLCPALLASSPSFYPFLHLFFLNPPLFFHSAPPFILI